MRHENLLWFHIRRLEKETENRAASTQAEVDYLVNQRVPEAVRSAMKETMEVKAQFSQLSQHALVLTEENSALRARRSQLSVDVGNLEQMLKEVSRQSCIQKKVCFFCYVSKLSSSVRNLSISLILNPLLLISPVKVYIYACPFCICHLFSPHSSSSLHQTIEKLRGNYQRTQLELNDCRHNLKNLQTNHREVLAEMEAPRSVYSCSPCLREV